MTKLWIAHAKTESCDNYYFIYKDVPIVADVVERVCMSETGSLEDIKFYSDTTCVDVDLCEVIE